MSSKSEETNARFRRLSFRDIEERYGKELDVFFQLCFGKNEITEQERIDFAYELDEIIEGHKRRSIPSYYDQMAECKTDFSNAAKHLRNAVEKFYCLDVNHWKAVCTCLEDITPDGARKDLSNPDGIVGLLALLNNAAVLSDMLSVCIFVAGLDQLQKRRQGNKLLPYLQPTMELINLWERWTRNKVKFAKAFPKKHQGGGEPAQNSTEFIRLALRRLDPTVSAANAITSINNCRDARLESREILLNLAPDPESNSAICGVSSARPGAADTKL